MADIKTNCPICDAQISVPEGTVESEILTCEECENRIVVASLDEKGASLEEAPEIEEDWGE